MLDKMRDIKEGHGTLLDNSMVFSAAASATATSTTPKNSDSTRRPRRRFDHTGRHIAKPQGTPLCNLYVSMLERMGCPVEKFGDSTEPMWEISQG